MQTFLKEQEDKIQALLTEYRYMEADAVDSEIKLLLECAEPLYELNGAVTPKRPKRCSLLTGDASLDPLPRLSATALGLNEEDLHGVPEQVIQELHHLERKKDDCVWRRDFKGAHRLHQEMTHAVAHAVKSRQEAPSITSERIATPSKASWALREAPKKSSSARALDTLKVVLLGERSAGKSSFFAHAVYGRSDHKLKGSNPRFAKKNFTTETGLSASLVLWDSPGVPTLRALPPLYYKDADALIVIFDAAAGASSGRRARTMIGHLRDEMGDVPIALVANKCDLDDEAKRVWSPFWLHGEYHDVVQPITKEGRDHVAEINQTDFCFPVSAKEGSGVTETLSTLVDVVLKSERVKALGLCLKPQPN